jgi:hypothetical protein
MPEATYSLTHPKLIDISFDFRTDAGDRDPDSRSATLRRYHRILWSKPLPSGDLFDLADTSPGIYLHHHSKLGEFFLSSDNMAQTFIQWPALYPITRQLSDDELGSFFDIGCTIGAMTIFPGNQIARQWTINQARGLLRPIADRFDLTLECIRRHYAGETSPLTPTIERYRDFLDLFVDFGSYVEFFLLQDLVDPRLTVRFFMPFDDFRIPAVPTDVASYRLFRQSSMEFTSARTERIGAWAATATA